MTPDSEAPDWVELASLVLIWLAAVLIATLLSIP